MKPAGYTLFVLSAIFAINSLDRHILSITLNQIGAEFSLTDTQLGLLSGLLFAVVYVMFGFPVAKMSAKGNRRNIVAASVAIWSILTIAIAGAQNFTQLALARLGVGIGEAGAVAPSHSMISDLYGENKRTSAMATFVTGANIGVLLAFLVGGIGGQLLGWRWAFVIAGVPGLVLALLLRFTIAEPRREQAALTKIEHRSLFIVTLKTIWDDRGLFHAMMGISIVGIVTFGALAWNPSFIIRAHNLTQAQTGIFLALTIGIGGGFGTWFSGWLADRWGNTNPRWRIGMVVAVILISKPFIVGFLMFETRSASLISFIGTAMIASVFWGPTFAFLHSRIAPHMRPMATAIYLFCFNLVGAGIGPTLIGVFSDRLYADAGVWSIAYAILTVQIAGIWAAWHYWQVMGTIDKPHPSSES